MSSKSNMKHWLMDKMQKKKKKKESSCDWAECQKFGSYDLDSELKLKTDDLNEYETNKLLHNTLDINPIQVAFAKLHLQVSLLWEMQYH